MSYQNLLIFNTKSTLLPSSLSTNNMIKLSSKINTSNLKSKIELIDSVMSDEYYIARYLIIQQREMIFLKKN